MNLKMNPFTLELKKLCADQPGIYALKFVGRACYADLGGDFHLKAEFVSDDSGFPDEYDVLKLTAMSRQLGVMDVQNVYFSDVLEKQPPSFGHGPDKMVPFISEGAGKNWSSHEPSPAEYGYLRTAVSNFAEVFCAPEQTREQGQSMF